MTSETDPRLSLGDWLHAAYTDERAGCPPPEAFLEAEAGDLTPEERSRLDRHADRCPACAAERDLARLFDAAPEAARVRPEDVGFVVARLESTSPVRTSEAAGRVVPFPAARRRIAGPVWSRLAAAAAVLLAAGLFFQTLGPGAPPLPPPEPGGVVRGGGIEAVSPLGEVAEMPAELRWTPQEGARSYRVRLVAVDDTVLWEETVAAVAAVAAPRARLPAAVAGRLHPAVVYTWSVEALDASGSRLAATEPVQFRVRPRL